jgi:NADH-quinone oxidoreductase subunit K
VSVGLGHYLVLSGVLFALGVLGVIARRNAIVVLMAVELMLNAGNLALVAFGRYLHSFDGQVIVLLVMTVAAAEAAIGLAILIAVFRTADSLDVDRTTILKG